MDKQASPTHEKQDTSAEPKPETAQNSSSDAVTLLKNDHRIVEQLFTKFEAAKSNEDKQKIAKQICTELVVHTMLEEEIFCPACREKKVEDDLLDEAPGGARRSESPHPRPHEVAGTQPLLR